MQRLRPYVQRLVDKRVGALLAGQQPADLIKALVLPMSTLVICELIGIPYERHEFFQSRSQSLLDFHTPDGRRGPALMELLEYLSELAAANLAASPLDRGCAGLRRSPARDRRVTSPSELESWDD
ncbi:hypothetical protein [Streptomyces sp. NPDC020362]|uniref:hypothetical protein n=1 Tax=unclassified Streptomyces TaxID=2593676 RepID=UPI0033DFDE54